MESLVDFKNSILLNLHKGNDVRIFICHSNLHLLQTLTLQGTGTNLCLYTSAVSKEFLQTHFHGQVLLVNDTPNISTLDIYPIKNILKSYWRNLTVFAGNKHNLWTSYVLNNFPTKKLTLLDDGLSSYGISEELYWEKSPIKALLKKLVSRVFGYFKLYYFHESNNAVIDRKCTAHFFFPNLIQQHDKVKKLGVDINKLKQYSYKADSIEYKNVHVASYDESKELIKLPNPYHGVFNLMHPRVSGEAPKIPTEIIVSNSTKVSVGTSSLIMYLRFVDYQGEYIFKGNDKAEQVYQFFNQ